MTSKRAILIDHWDNPEPNGGLFYLELAGQPYVARPSTLRALHDACGCALDQWDKEKRGAAQLWPPEKKKKKRGRSR